MHVGQAAVLDIQRVTSKPTAVSQQHALGAIRRDLNFGGDGVRAILEIDRGVLELRCHAGVVDMAIALGHSRGLAFAHTQLHA